MKFETVNREDWTGQKLDVTTWEDEISFMTWTLTALQGLSFVLIVILIAIIVIGIMNTMWIAIRERTREIGTLRAIGMQRRDGAVDVPARVADAGPVRHRRAARPAAAAHRGRPQRARTSRCRSGLQFFLMSDRPAPVGARGRC